LPNVFERGENLLQNGILATLFWISQLSKKLRIHVHEKTDFSEKGSTL